MFFVDDPRRLNELEVDRSVWRLQNAAAGEAVRMSGSLSRHDDLTWSNGQLDIWLLFLQNEEEVALPIV